MELTVLSASTRDHPGVQTASSYVVGSTLCVDAGVLGFALPLSMQQAVTDVVLTHAHNDHIAALPMFLENVYVAGGSCPRIHATASTLAVLRDNVFNGQLWPDLKTLSTPGREMLAMRELVPGTVASIAGFSITAVPVHHAVPCVGLVVDNGQNTLVFSGDTGPTWALWETCAGAGRPPVAAVMLECSFPDELADLARLTGHLTPTSFGVEARKLPGEHRLLATHLKPRFRDRIAAELGELGLGERLLIAGEADTLNVPLRF